MYDKILNPLSKAQERLSSLSAAGELCFDMMNFFFLAKEISSN